MAKTINLTDEQKAILVSRIEPYMDKFTKFFRLGHIRLTDAESKELSSLMREINPRYNFNYKLNCNSCIRETVTSLSNFYSRERSKVEFPLPSEPLKEEDEVNDETTERISPLSESVETNSEVGKVNTAEANEELLTTEAETEEVIKDDAYYESLDKRTTEYKNWLASKTEQQ